ncbi:hypothetical protein [Piscinibacter sp. HJYY11]|uniref:hypothetical protein n=1 Tax=Piscinibacter sp. HJYY11 TaxID=2801333 RepID=UPI00191DF9C3|nr:hypothetical protein [Piscinibacter sp. HJYY11]MBL0727099.1 hypothetical protein [Piscinibacter sp. HJYY11]
MQVRYAFESSDSLAQFTGWLLHGHLLLFALVPFSIWGWASVPAWLLLGALHIAGLRASITVTDAEVVIMKKWFFIPYSRHRAPVIADVWYGGDWGLEEGAICLVVKLGDKEVTIGTSKNMRDLYVDLLPYTAPRFVRGEAT